MRIPFVRLGRLAGRRPLLLLLATAAVSLAALVPASRLRLQGDLLALLPDGAPAADEYRAFLTRFGGQEKVLVLLSAESDAPPPPEDLAEASNAFAAAVAAKPTVADARAGLRPEDEAFFREWAAPRAWLLGEEGARGDEARRSRLAPDRLRERARWIKEQLVSPGGTALAPWLAADPLGASLALLQLRGGGRLPVDLETGAFLSEDRRAALVIVTPKGSEIDPEAGRALIADLDAAWAETRAEHDVPLRMRAIGGPLYAAYDEAILRQDLMRTGSGAFFSVFLILIVALDGILLPVAAMLAVGVGLLWTAAIAGVTFSPISAVGVGFTAILVGLGEDYVVHGGARYRELRGEGEGSEEAMGNVFHDTGPGILSSAVTTAAGFGVLALAHFRPLRELGGVVALGILATLLASVFAAAPFLAAVGGGAPPRRRRSLWLGIQRAVAWVTDLAAKYPRTILIGAGVATLLAGVGIGSLGLDADPRTLRPADHPLLAAEQEMQARFAIELDTTTVVVQARDLDAALDGAAVAADLLRERLGPEAEVLSPSDWLLPASTAARRVARLDPGDLAAAAPTFAAALDEAGLAVGAFAPFLSSLEDAASGAIPSPPPRDLWPDWLAAAIREGADGAAVAVQVRLRGEHGSLPAPVVAELRAAVPGVAVAAAARVGEELHALALGDLRRLGAAGLALVALVVLISFRGDLARGGQALLPVLIGTTWAFGLWGALGRNLDLVCVATLPVLAGIGIDDGLHILHGARARPGEGVRGALRWAGPPMLVANLTTVVGFASLVVSRVPALRNAGMLTAVGISACLFAALVVLPAIEALRASKGT